MLPNFSWVLPGQLAGMAQPGPGLFDQRDRGILSRHLDELVEAGVGALVSLCESPLDRVQIAHRGLRYLHLPVGDMTAPSLEEVDRVVCFLDRARDDDLAAAVHCQAGFGRTGTMLACYLVGQGCAPDAAMEKIRSLRPGSIETHDQEQIVQAYSEHRHARSRG